MRILSGKKFIIWGTLMMLGCLPVARPADRPAGSGKDADRAVIGKIINSSGTFLNGVALPVEGTLTSGSTLKTEEHGTAQVRFSADTQVTLGERTSVSFESNAGRVVAEVASGSIAAWDPGKNALVLETTRYTIEPAGGPATYGVTMLPDKNTEVVARRGPVAITEKSSGRKYVLAEGHYAEVAGAGVPPSGQPQAQAGAATTAATTAGTAAPTGLLASGPAMFVISVGAGVGVGLGVAEGPLSEPGPPASPSAP
ncbi:MAG TPA: FecR domain-containing protein [Terriglobia bacterium]|nr:FecR domain-containing protein [Terriglobia bacterium]